MPNSTFSLSIRDYAGEISRFRVHITTLTAANFAATITALDTLSTAVQGVIIGVRARQITTADDSSLSNGLPSSPLAQRENKWLARSEDNVTHVIGRNEIPTADLTLLTNNSEIITDFTPAALAALKSAWEAVVVSEDGNNVTLRSLQYVGKRL